MFRTKELVKGSNKESSYTAIENVSVVLCRAKSCGYYDTSDVVVSKFSMVKLGRLD